MVFQDFAAGLRSRFAIAFVDREFFMRSGGDVKFIKLSAKLQKRVAVIGGLLCAALLAITGTALAGVIMTGAEQSALAKQQQRVASAQERVAAYRSSIDDVAHDLKARQDRLDRLYEGHFGSLEDAALPDADVADTTEKVSTLIPEAAPLARLEARQLAFVSSLTRLADHRSKRAEAAIRKFGLDPRGLLSSQEASGGPFIPAGNLQEDDSDPRFASLASKLDRMDSLERLLAAIPTSKPAAITAMSSNFGYRRDPFTGAGALHSGIDFRGPSGTPILAASDGKVTFAGTKGGYGRCIEITHASGIVTRYAHMRKLIAKRGETVQRGEQIGAMGSTGRSTGSHLHFEVRVNGRAVNPAKFLEANPDVFQIQADARSRTDRDA